MNFKIIIQQYLDVKSIRSRIRRANREFITLQIQTKISRINGVRFGKQVRHFGE